MGCFRTLGCLVAAIALAVIAFVFRAQWLPLVEHAAGGTFSTSSAPAATTRWERITIDGASRARDAVSKLGVRSGPVFANISPGDLASYVFDTLSQELPASATNVEVAGAGDTLLMRADVRLADFGGAAAFGPLGSVLGDREPVRFGGVLEMVKPGLARFRVTSLRIKDLPVPSPMIPKLVRNATRGRRPAGVADDALPLPLPPFIGDIRVHDDKITLYKTIP